MLERAQELFTFPVIAITTNGDINRFGACVMGRGCALQAKTLYPNIAIKLGTYLQKYGNRVFNMGIWGKHHILTFPVKHHWHEMADPKLIVTSCEQLIHALNKFDIPSIALPRPGCGNGHLNWNTIKPLIAPLLDDRVTVVHKDERRV